MSTTVASRSAASGVQTCLFGAARHCAVKCLSTWLMMTCISSPKATNDPFGLPGERYHVRTTALKTEALALSARVFGTVPRGLWTRDISYKRFKALLKTYMFRQGHGAL